MGELLIRGNIPLCGNVEVGGRKNSAVAVLPTVLLAEGTSALENLPAIRDVSTYRKILMELGAEVSELEDGVMEIDASGLKPDVPPLELVKQIRASYYLLGALLGRFGYARVGLPGGCDIGQRPVDQHLKGFKALGAEVKVEHGEVVAEADQLEGDHIYLDVASVGATINIMLAAVMARGTTVMENCAREPHIVDVASCLNSMGARVVGAGTDTIKIHGVEHLHPTSHAIIPDEIEAATYAIATSATGGEITLRNVVPKHLESVIAKLRESGIEVEDNGDWIRVRSENRPQAIQVKTLPYPGFPTDAMPPMMVLLAIAEGTSVVSEGVYESRFKHVDQLQRMGTDIQVQGRTAVIEGVEQLYGTSVNACTLRAGAALVIAGLVAEGETIVSGIEHVERGYEFLRTKLRAIGADVQRTGGSESAVDGEGECARVVNLGNMS